jgi:hypothetical protein
MRLKPDAAARVKNGVSTLFEPPVQIDGTVVKKKHALTERTKPKKQFKEAEADAALQILPQDQNLFALQEPQAPAGFADEGIAFAAVDPGWYVEPGTTPVASDAPKPSWSAAPVRPDPTLAEPNLGTAIGKPTTPTETVAPADTVPAARGPALSPMGLNAVGIAFGGLGLGLAGGGKGGGGGGSANASANTAAKASTSSIKVVDGPIAGARVYLDMNDNGKYDAGVDKPLGITDANGSLDIATTSLGQHGLLAVGGTNDNGMPNASTLSLAMLADKAGTLVVVSPLTSLVSAVYLKALQSNPKATFNEAERDVKSALGLDKETRSISSIDPTSGGELALLKIGVLLASLAAVPESVAASGQDSLASYIFRNKPTGGAMLTQLASADGLLAVFASDLQNLSAADKAAALTSLRGLAGINAKLMAASSASDLASATDLSSSEISIPKILGLSYDTGTSSTDKITSIAQLSVSSLGGTTQLSIDKGVTWFDASSFAPTDGSLTVIARANFGANSAGKLVLSGSSAPFSFTLISAVPTAPTISLNLDTGVSATDHITQVGAFTVNAKPVNGSVLQYSTDGRNWGATLDQQQEAGLAKDGTHTVYVRQIAPSVGLSSAVNRLDFTLDTHIDAGSANVSETEGADASPTDGITRNERPTLQGDTDPGNTVTFKLGITTYSVIADASGHWSFNPRYSPGDSDIITFFIRNAAGRTLSKLPPLSASDAVFNGTTDPGNSVAFTLGNTTYSVLADAMGRWIFPNESSKTIPLSIHDAAGNTTRDTLPLTVDDTVFQGNTDPGNTVVFTLGLTEYSVVADSSGHWVFPDQSFHAHTFAAGFPAYTFAEKSVNIALAISDAAGNTTSKLLPLTVDLTAPDDTTVSFGSPTSHAVVGLDADGIAYFKPDAFSAAKPLTLKGIADLGAKVEVYIADTLVGATTASLKDGSWSYDWDGLIDGSRLKEDEYTTQVVVTDLAGNVGDLVDGTVLMVDKTAPDEDTVTPDSMSSNATYGEDDNWVMYFNAKSLNSKTPLTFSGTVDIGATVKLYIADALVATIVLSPGDDVWSFDWDGRVGGSMLADGSYHASVVVTDLAGNVSSVTQRLPGADGDMPFVIDNMAPTADTVTVALAEGMQTGIDPKTGDIYTNLTDVTVVGKAEPLTLLLVTAGTEEYELNADENGDWTQDLSLEDGSYTVWIVATDLAGNASQAIKGPSFTVDATAPNEDTVSFNLPTSQATVGFDVDDIAYFKPDAFSAAKPLTFSGTADLGATIRLNIDHILVDTFTASATDGTWHYAWNGLVNGRTLKEDLYTAEVVVNDWLGNTSYPLDDTVFIVDATAPDDSTVITNALASDATYGTDDNGVMYFNAQSLNSSKPLTFSGTVDVGAKVNLYIGNALLATIVASSDNGSWSFKWNGMVNGRMLADGSYHTSIVVTDLAGNVSAPLPASDGDLPFVIDTIVPALTAHLADGDQTGIGPTTGTAYTSNADATISGNADSLASLLFTLGGQNYSVTAAEDGSWNLPLTGLADGSYTVSITATDLAGNVAQLVNNRFFTLDTVPEYFSGSADAGYGSVIGTHKSLVVGSAVVLNPFADLKGHVAPSTGFHYADYMEDYSGSLPTGLALGQDGRITGTPTAAGQTWLAIHSFDFAGNESTSYAQLVTTSTPYTASTTATTVTVSGSSARQYTANALANNVYITASVGVVVFAGLGDDTIIIGNSSTIDSSKVPFARIDGGGGVDTLSFSFPGESVDLSGFNNPDGLGGVIEHVEKLKFVGSKGKESSVDLSAADVFHLQSDTTDANGRALVVLTAASTSNQYVTANLNSDDFTQVGNANSYTSTGGAANGTSNIANYTKFFGSYADYLGSHDLTVLVQGYYILG